MASQCNCHSAQLLAFWTEIDWGVFFFSSFNGIIVWCKHHARTLTTKTPRTMADKLIICNSKEIQIVRFELSHQHPEIGPKPTSPLINSSASGGIVLSPSTVPTLESVCARRLLLFYFEILMRAKIFTTRKMRHCPLPPPPHLFPKPSGNLLSVCHEELWAIRKLCDWTFHVLSSLLCGGLFISAAFLLELWHFGREHRLPFFFLSWNIFWCRVRPPPSPMRKKRKGKKKKLPTHTVSSLSPPS